MADIALVIEGKENVYNVLYLISCRDMDLAQYYGSMAGLTITEMRGAGILD